MAQFSRSALDKIATDLSMFDDPKIPELSLTDDKTLQNNMLASVLGAFSGTANAEARHMMTNIVRRTSASIEAYRLGRKSAMEYVGGNRFGWIAPYFHSLTFFESCVAYSWQVCDQLNYLAKGRARVYQRGDGTAWEKLHNIYTIGTKHPFGRYVPAQHGEVPTTVWLTNDGIESIDGSHLTYRELSEIIAANNDLFYAAQERAVRRARSKRPA